jgi:hypothetical protein
LKINAFFLFLFICLKVSAHGEDKPGPNGGSIRMPGAFHTELLIVDKNILQIYLLDMEWQNPKVKNSQVEVTLSHAKNIKGKCQPQNEYFICKFPQEVNLSKKGQLLVASIRENQKGNDVTYQLPLSAFKKLENPHMGHH